MKKIKPFRECHYCSLKKILLIMRIALILMIFGILQVNAKEVYSQSTKLSLSFSETELVNVLDKIEGESEFFFLYNEKLLDTKRKVSINAKDELIGEILNGLFNGTDVKYTIIDRKIILVPEYLAPEPKPQPQQLKITGTIKDDTGNALPGVNITIDGTTVGVISDVNGKYSINLPNINSVLVFSFVGYVVQKIPFAGQTTIDVTLISNLEELEEVVVIGYGTQKKLDVTGAVSSVKVADMQKIASTNTSVALQGQVSGVNIVQTNADPGAGADIRIRGIGTLNNHFPLVIVDGVPSDINKVDPKDIESVNILKDAASAAIYGSRAANGVVLITTKRGTGSGQKAKIEYRGYTSFNNREKDFGLINNSNDYIKVAKMAADNSGEPYPLFVTQYEDDPSQFGNTDWENEMFRQAIEQKHELSVSKSGENYNFYISSGFKNEEGIRLGSSDKQFSTRVNSDFRISKRLRIGESVGYTQNQGMYFQNTYFFWQLVMTNPLQKIYDSTTPSGWAPALRDIGFKTSENPVRDYTINESTYKNDAILASAYLEFEPVKNLKYLFRISQNYSRNTTFLFNPTYYSDFYDQNKENYISESYGNRMYNIMDNILSYSIDLSRHSLSALAGYSAEDNIYHWFSGAGSRQRYTLKLNKKSRGGH
jgi:TonB-dependent starch-binding outer membrane protein SusC